MKNYLESSMIWLGFILLALAFITALEMPKVFFILVVVMNLSLCLGSQWLFTNDVKMYPFSFVIASISTFLMVVLVDCEAHIAMTFLPSSLVAGNITAAIMNYKNFRWFDIFAVVMVFLLVWAMNLMLMSLCM